jgi:hypothetical protein
MTKNCARGRLNLFSSTARVESAWFAEPVSNQRCGARLIASVIYSRMSGRCVAGINAQINVQYLRQGHGYTLQVRLVHFARRFQCRVLQYDSNRRLQVHLAVLQLLFQPGRISRLICRVYPAQSQSSLLRRLRVKITPTIVIRVNHICHVTPRQCPGSPQHARCRTHPFQSMLSLRNLSP